MMRTTSDERRRDGVNGTTSEGKPMKVSSDVQCPVSEGMYGGSARRKE